MLILLGLSAFTQIIYEGDNMNINKAFVTNISKLTTQHKNEHKNYEYYKKIVLSGDNGDKCNVSVYEIPPKKSAYPYHYHLLNQETFYIISGVGTLRTPVGEMNITAGDILVFPPSEAGAHKITNSSDTEMLIYIDFSTYNSTEVSFMPDSNKTVIYGKDVKRIAINGMEADYYDGE